MRIGHGFDVHRFSDDPSRALWLGLNRVEGPGLDGHSDADVVAHALADALLGAAGLGDLGTHFPNSDVRWLGVASREILTLVTAKLEDASWRLVNADVTVVAEQPRLAPHRIAMEAALSEVVGAPVTLKATTSEGLGFTGRGEGIAAFAVCIVEERL